MLKTNCIRQPQSYIVLPSLSCNHNTCTELPHNSCASFSWLYNFLTATLKCICNDSFIDVLRVVIVYCGCKMNWAAAYWVALSN